MADFLAENELVTLRNRFKRDAELLLQGISDDGEEKSESFIFAHVYRAEKMSLYADVRLAYP